MRMEEGQTMNPTLEQTPIAELASREDAYREVIVASLDAVNKNYGDIRALRGVDFRVRAGEVRRPRHQLV